MGEWQASALAGLGAGLLVVVVALVFRRRAPEWTGGGRLAVFIVAAVLIGAGAPVLLRPSEAHPVHPDDNTLTRLAERLASADLSDRLAAIAELDQLGQYDIVRLPEIVELAAGFVRDRAPGADDPKCAESRPAEDVDAALRLLRARTQYHDGTAIVDLHGTCLANADLRAISVLGGKLADANLAGANLKSADLSGADLARTNLAGASLAGTSLIDTRLVDARFAETDLSGAQFSDDTLWPSQHEDAVMAASSFATTTFLIAQLTLSDPR